MDKGMAKDHAMDRRTFVAGTAVAGVTAVASAAIAQAAEKQGESSGEDSARSSSTDSAAGYDADVLVVGLGTSGIMAAYQAGLAGASVIAIDVAATMEGTTNINTTAPMAIGSKAQAEANPDATVTVKEAYQEIVAETHYQENSKLLRHMLEVSGEPIDAMVAHGMQFMYANTMCTADSPLRAKTGCIYLLSGSDRAAVFNDMLDEAGVDRRFGLRATEALTDTDGVVCGVRCEDGTEIRAKAVVLACGGFLANEDMTAQYYAGAHMLTCGCANAKGDGVNMALALGAQMGKNFSVSMNEFGGANFKATPMQYTYIPEFECNSVLRLAIIAYPMVDVHGDRFMDEGIVCGHAMYSGEPLIRESTYYTVFDQALIDRIKSEPLGNFLNTEDPANVASLLVDMQLTNIEDDFAQAQDEGWAYKADTLEELAEHFGLTDLPQTIEHYNEMCDAGEDTDFFKEERYLYTVKEPPFYIAQYNPSAWLSLGGIKTDADCHALDSENARIPALFISGADADLWGVPYVYPGSANGFCLASGWIAGQSAAAYALGE